MKIYTTACLLVILSAIGCKGTIPEPTSRQAAYASQKWPGVTRDSLFEGRKLFISKCSGCHSLVAPSELTVSQWDTSLVKMKSNAKLTDKEFDAVRMYVLSMADK